MRNVIFAATAAFALLASAGMSSAQDDLTVIGTGFTGRPFVVEGDLVMESIGLYEMIRTIDDPTRPTYHSYLVHDQEGFWGDVLHENGLLVAIHNEVLWGYQIASIADPDNPELIYSTVGNVYTSGWLRGNALILAEAGFCIVYDISDLTAPVFAAARVLANNPDKRWFSEIDDTLYLIDQGNELRGFDVTDPLAPVDLGNAVLTGTHIEAVVAAGGALQLLVASEDGGLVTIDLVTLLPTGTMQFAETGRATLGSGPGLVGMALVQNGNLLLASLSDATVHAFGLEDPLQPSPGYVLPRLADHLAIAASNVFVSEADSLHIYGRTPAETAPLLALSRPVLPDIRHVFGEGPVIMAQAWPELSVLHRFDVTDPWLPRMLEPYELGFGTRMHHDDGLLAATGGTPRCDLWDVSNPVVPTLLTTIVDPEHNLQEPVMGSDRLAFPAFSAGSGITVVYDVYDPTTPVRGLVDDGRPQALGDGLLLLGDASPYSLYDVADVKAPELLSEIALAGELRSAVIARGYAYLIDREQGTDYTLRVFRLAQPAAPQEVFSQSVSPCRVAAVHGNRLYCMGETNTVYDIVVPSMPTLAGEYRGGTDGPAFFDDLAISGPWLITALDGGYDLTGTPGVPVASAVLEPAYPNPFNPSTTIAFSAPQAGDYTLSIHDLRGRRIVDLVRGAVPRGRHLVQWRGRDAAGHAVASGVYAVRLVGTGVDATRVVTLVK